MATISLMDTVEQFSHPEPEPTLPPLHIDMSTVATAITRTGPSAPLFAGVHHPGGRGRGGGGTPGGGRGGGGTPGGGGMPGGTPLGGHAMLGALLATPITQNGGLCGTPPQIFTGDRSCTDLFINEFLLYKNLNRNHEVMSVPYT